MKNGVEVTAIAIAVVTASAAIRNKLISTAAATT